ncbi:hypothetical protein D9M72_586990 [compost metagenome]
MCVDQRDDADVDGEDLLYQPHDPFKALILRRVENVEMSKGGQAIEFPAFRVRRRPPGWLSNHHSVFLSHCAPSK